MKKNEKALAVLLAAAMMAGLCSCSSKEEEYEKPWVTRDSSETSVRETEETLDDEEDEFDEFETIETEATKETFALGDDEAENLQIVTGGLIIEGEAQNIEVDLMDIDAGLIMKIPADAIDTTSAFIMDGNMLHDVDSEEPYFEDCESMIVFFRSPYDLEDVTQELINIVEYPDVESAKAEFEQLMAEYEILGLDLSTLSDCEYHKGEDSGYFILKVDFKSYFEYLAKEDPDDKDDMGFSEKEMDKIKEHLRFATLSIAWYWSGDRLYIVSYTYADPALISTEVYIRSLGFISPEEMQNSDIVREKLAKLIAEYYRLG